MSGLINFGLLDPETSWKGINAFDPQKNALMQAQLQQAQGANKLQEYSLSQAQRLDVQQNALQRMVQSGFDPNNPDHINKLLMFGKPGMELAKTINESKKSSAETGAKLTETTHKTLAMQRDQLAGVNDPQAMAAWVQSQYTNPDTARFMATTGTAASSIAKIPQDPAAFAQYKQQVALGMTKFIEQNKPTIHMQNLGGASQVVSVPGLGGDPSVLSRTPTTQTPDAMQTDQRVRSEGALNRGVTIRGQNMTDTRMRDTPHYVIGTDESGQQIVTPFTKEGMGTPAKTGAMNPSWMTQGVIAERQLRGQLDKSIAPHLQTLDAAQKFEQIRASGDNSTANQMLAQQIAQMSKAGSRAMLPQKQLEQILGTTFEGNDIPGRIANYVSQLASGTRTAEQDRKLSAVADAMSLAAAQRVGQEIQNTVARTPAGTDAERIVGTAPRIYGRYIITPTGKVYAGKDSADAQAKLAAMKKAAGE